MGDTSAVFLAANLAEEGGSNFLVPNGTFFVVLIIFFITVGLVEAAYFINLAFMALFVFATPVK
jgi:hypothetical protein